MSTIWCAWARLNLDASVERVKNILSLLCHLRVSIRLRSTVKLFLQLSDFRPGLSRGAHSPVAMNGDLCEGQIFVRVLVARTIRALSDAEAPEKSYG